MTDWKSVVGAKVDDTCVVCEVNFLVSIGNGRKRNHQDSCTKQILASNSPCLFNFLSLRQVEERRETEKNIVMIHTVNQFLVIYFS